MKWEYLSISLDENEKVSLSKILNKLGGDDWELIHCDLGENVLVFKRPESLDIKGKYLFDSDIIDMRKAIEGYFGGKIG